MKKGLMSLVFAVAMVITFSTVSYATGGFLYQTAKAYQGGAIVVKYDVDYERDEWKTVVYVFDYYGERSIEIGDSIYINTIEFFGDNQVFLVGCEGWLGRSSIFVFSIYNFTRVTRIDLAEGEYLSSWQILSWRNAATLATSIRDLSGAYKRLVRFVDFSTKKLVKVATFSEDIKITLSTDSENQNYTVLTIGPKGNAAFYLVTEKNKLSLVDKFGLNADAEIAFVSSDIDFISVRYKLPRLKYIELGSE